MKTEAEKKAQAKYLAKRKRCAGIWLNPSCPIDAIRIEKYDALLNKAQAIREWLDSLDN